MKIENKEVDYDRSDVRPNRKQRRLATQRVKRMVAKSRRAKASKR
jgi:hypothetical protein